MLSEYKQKVTILSVLQAPCFAALSENEVLYQLLCFLTEQQSKALFAPMEFVLKVICFAALFEIKAVESISVWQVFCFAALSEFKAAEFHLLYLKT